MRGCRHRAARIPSSSGQAAVERASGADPVTNASHEKVAVVGAGLMGHGIGYIFAAAGHPVAVYDADDTVLASLSDRCDGIGRLLGHDPAVATAVVGQARLDAAVADASYVIEAVPEVLALKRRIFADLERHAPARAILASNTSVIPISDIADGLERPERVIGTHFWNPPYLVPLVEVVQMCAGNLPAVERMIAVLTRAGCRPVHVRRDIPGFIGNRLQHALKREAIALVADGVCDAETIDTVVKLGFGPRLAVLGPLEQSDMVGLDLTRNIHDVLIPHLDRTPATHAYLASKVANGDLGMKTGRGFRDWTLEQAQAVRDRLRDYLAEQARRR